jgi:hypothetical protein
MSIPEVGPDADTQRALVQLLRPRAMASVTVST